MTNPESDLILFTMQIDDIVRIASRRNNLKLTHHKDENSALVCRQENHRLIEPISVFLESVM